MTSNWCFNTNDFQHVSCNGDELRKQCSLVDVDDPWGLPNGCFRGRASAKGSKLLGDTFLIPGLAAKWSKLQKDTKYPWVATRKLWVFRGFLWLEARLSSQLGDLGGSTEL